MLTALVVFVLAYALIAGARVPGLKLDRPSGALLGAVAMVAFGVVSPAEAARDAVNVDTLLLLLGMMIVSAYLVEAGVFRYASWFTLTHVHSPRRLLVALVFVSGVLSAVLVNDTVCLMFTPLVVQLVQDAKLKPLPFLLALAFGANAGSVATPTGNPQNMIIGTSSQISYAAFTGTLFFPAIVALVVVAAVLVAMFRADLPARRLVDAALPRPEVNPRLATGSLVVLAGIVVAFFAGAPLSWTAMTGAAALLLVGRIDPRSVFVQVDFVLLLFFGALFVVVFGVGRAGLAEAMFERLQPAFGTHPATQATTFGAFTVVASQVVSNVPFVLLAAHWMPHFAAPRLMWLSTALFSTLAGNLTIVGSVANMIVLEGAKEHGRVSFGTFLKYGSFVTILSLAAAFGVLWVEHLLGFV